MKKKLSILAVSVVALCACQREMVANLDGSAASRELSFETFVNKHSKGVQKDLFVMGDQFHVIGGKTDAAAFNGAADITGWMFPAPAYGVDVTHYGFDGANSIWKYPNPVSWGESKVTFFAFSPVPVTVPALLADDKGITNYRPTAANGGVIPSLDFAVKGGFIDAAPAEDQEKSRLETKKQIDLMWACTKDQTKAVASVGLDFKHALSQVRFSVRANQAVGFLRVNEILIEHVESKGKLQLSDGVWSAPTAPAPKNFLVNLKSDVVSLIPVTKVGQVLNVMDEWDSFFFIPQSLATATGVAITVKYSYSTDAIEWQNYESGTSINVPLEQITPQWEANKKYNYILSITPGKPIVFSAAIDVWDSEIGYEYAKVGAGGGEFITLTLATGDQIATVGANAWLNAIDRTGASKPFNGTPIVVAAGNAGEWKIAANANGTAAKRTETITVTYASGTTQTIYVEQFN